MGFEEGEGMRRKVEGGGWVGGLRGLQKEGNAEVYTCRCDIAKVVRYGWVVHERVGDHLEMLGERIWICSLMKPRGYSQSSKAEFSI